MRKVIAPMILALAVVMVAATGGSAVTNNSDLKTTPPDALTVHEWGTFTTVAGPDGHPIDWLPLGGPVDLPCFVDHFSGPPLKVAPPFGATVSYEQARSRLKGKVRMETPVLYFYAPQKKTLNVRVDFPGGLVTEWYPKANVIQPAVRERTLIENAVGSRIEWKNVNVLPGSTPNLPREGRPSHYYAARETDAAPVQVQGKDEKFLFYRGVGSFPVPLSAQVTPDGKILVAAAGSDAIPAIVLFENRGGKIGYRIHGKLQGQKILEPPSLGAGFASLQRELEQMLIAEGLYAKEAEAMVQTWRESWFEEGTRIFYIVPRQMVDTILPLTIDPPPAHVARAFVGRMEVITPAMVKRVEQAIAARDLATLAKHARFLGPITDRLASTPEIRALVDSAYKSFLGEVSSSCN
jgi:hypothetical protein